MSGGREMQNFIYITVGLAALLAVMVVVGMF